MALFFQHYPILLFLLLQVLTAQVQMISISDNARKLGIVPLIRNSPSLNTVRNASDNLRIAAKITATESFDYNWVVKWYQSMPIDHFSYRSVETFKLK